MYEAYCTYVDDKLFDNHDYDDDTDADTDNDTGDDTDDDISTHIIVRSGHPAGYLGGPRPVATALVRLAQSPGCLVGRAARLPGWPPPGCRPVAFHYPALVFTGLPGRIYKPFYVP